MTEKTEKMYYVICLKRSLCFWRSNNAGYTDDLQQAGKYSESNIRESLDYYNDGVDNIAIPCDVFEQKFKLRTTVDWGAHHSIIKNYKLKAKLQNKKLKSINKL